MSKLASRPWLRVLLALAVLFVLLLLLAPRLIPAQRVRGLIVARVADATGAQVSFGKAEVRLLPRLKVAVAEGRIAGTGEALRAASGAATPLVAYDVALDRLEVSLALGPLLRKRIELGKVRLIRPTVDVTTAAPAAVPDGQAGEPAAGGAEAAADDGGALPMALAVAGVEVRDGRLTWRQQGTGRAARLTAWQQQITAGDLSALLARLPALLGAGQPSAAAGAAARPAGGGGARIGLDTSLGELTLTGFGAVSPLRLQDLRLAAVLSLPPAADRLELQVTQAAWGPVALTAQLELLLAEPAGRRLRGTWRVADGELPPLLAAIAGLVPAPPGPLGEWWAGEPITQGRLALAGEIDLPWPLPAARPEGTDQEREAAAAALLGGLKASGELQGVRAALPLQAGTADLSAAFSLEDGRLRVDRLDVREAAGTLAVRGGAELALPARGGSLRVDLQGSADLSAVAAWRKLLPPPAPRPGAAPPPGGPLRLAGKASFTAAAVIPSPPLAEPALWQIRLQQGQLGDVKLSGTLTDLNVADDRLQPPLVVRSVTWSSDLRAAEATFEGAVHPAVKGGGDLRLTRLFPAPHAEVQLQLTLVDADMLARMYGPPPAEAAGRAAAGGAAGLLAALAEAAVPAVMAAAGVPGPAAPPPGDLIPPRLTADYRARSETVVLQKAKYEGVSLRGRLAGRVFDFDQVAGTLGGGRIAGSGKLDYAADPYGRLEFDAVMEEIPASALLEPYARTVAALWEGKVAGTVKGGCSLKDPREVLRTLALEGLALSTNGVIHGAPLLEAVTPYLGARQDLKVVRFKEMAHHFAVRDGRYLIKDLQLQGLDTDWWGDGWIGFDGGIDLNLRVKLPAGFRPELGEFGFLAEGLRGEDGRIALDLRLTGRAAKPEVNLDLTGAKAKARDQVKDQAEDKLKRGMDGLLDKLKRR